MTVNPALSITTAAALPTGYAGVAYSKTLAATGGSGTGYTWTVTTGGTNDSNRLEPIQHRCVIRRDTDSGKRKLRRQGNRLGIEHSNSHLLGDRQPSPVHQHRGDPADRLRRSSLYTNPGGHGRFRYRLHLDGYIGRHRSYGRRLELVQRRRTVRRDTDSGQRSFTAKAV